MAASLDDSGLWLPTHFLAEEEKLKSIESVDCGPDFCFPTEFPYEVDSPVESSTETDSSDDDDFLAGLTRRFAQSSFHGTQSLAGHGWDKPEKQWVSSGSPQSTLNGIGCWSGRSAKGLSPPATSFGFSNDTLELINAAAGEVARLKMNREATKLNNNQGGLLGSLNLAGASFYSPQTLPQANHQYHQFVKQEHAVLQPCSADFGRPVKAAWPTHLPHQHQQQIYNYNGVVNVGLENRGCGPRRAQLLNPEPQAQRNGPGMRPVFPGGNVAKRESAGTGVFLPRRYTIPSECPKKTGSTPVLVPAKVVQALNFNFNVKNGHAPPRAGVVPDHEALLARRNALLMQQRRGMRTAPEVNLSREVRLPQEWTY